MDTLFGRGLGMSNEFERFRNSSSIQNNETNLLPFEIGMFQENKKRLKVASYCRVSTEQEMQMNSLDNQIIHYTNYIRSNSDWKFVGIYSDKGITGTNRNRRSGFNRMVRDALAGEIDLIICKSISRFSRNVIDTLDVVRLLLENGISVWFEEENLNTGEIESEVIISLISVVAQEESNQISQNLKWAHAIRSSRGDIPFFRILGYKKNSNKEWVVDYEEAQIVREAFELYVKGTPIKKIAERFISFGYKKVNGKTDWDYGYISGILKNEKYTGDVLCQKTYTKDFISHSSAVNYGERDQYFIRDHHKAIVEREIFKEVQKKISKGKGRRNTQANRYSLSSRVICGNCGGKFHRQKNKREVAWKCSNRTKSHQICMAPLIYENDIKKAMIKAFKNRYEIAGTGQNKRQIVRMIKDIQNSMTFRIFEQNRASLDLERALLNESNAIVKGFDLTEVRRSRQEVEEKIEQKEKWWDLVDRDEHFRSVALDKLEALKIKPWPLEELLKEIEDVDFLRAWIVQINVTSSTLLRIDWINGDQTTLDLEGI